MIEELNVVAHHLSFYQDITKVVLFGSRARGDFDERSDYDIAIYGVLDEKTMLDINYFLKNGVRGIYKIDVVYIQLLDNDACIAEKIEKEGVILYERN